MNEDDIEAIPWYCWIGLLYIAGVNFWLQAVITEERFVPALNIIANWLEIPDDVAGATLMAGGASMPELFSSFVALFVTHSALGVGTIIGSGVFNQLVIVAGAILASRGDTLQLDPIVQIRDASFYGIGIVCLLYIFSRKEIADDDLENEPYIIITPFSGGILLVGYISYIMVCIKFEKILLLIKKIPLLSRQLEKVAGGMCYGTLYAEQMEMTHKIAEMAELTKITLPQIPFLRLIRHEPSQNFHENNLSWTMSSSNVSTLSRTSVACGSKKAKPTGEKDCFETYEMSEKPSSSLNGLETVTKNEEDGSISCYLWQQSTFYSKARIDVKAWELRQFTFTDKTIQSTSDISSRQSYKYKYISLSKIEVDDHHLLLKFHRNKTSQRPYILMAPNCEVLIAVVTACDRILKKVETIPEADEVSDSLKLVELKRKETDQVQTVELESCGNSDELITDDASDKEVREHHESLIAYPVPSSSPITNGNAYKRKIVLYYILFPFRALVHFTIPDVRKVAHSQQRGGSGGDHLPVRLSMVVILICLVNLICSSYFLVESLEELGKQMRIPQVIIGITVSAAGTSVANFVASQCAAKQGLGNMAVCNAFGSNSFIIFVGLGLPWLTFTATKQGGTLNYALRDDGLTHSVILQAISLIFFMATMWCNDFCLKRKHGYLFVTMYVLYVCLALVESYLR